MKLLGDDALERSSVVANCQMNRQRTLTGTNGYAKELRLNPLDFLLGRRGAKVWWLDLCCGEGKALVEAAQIIHEKGLDDKIEIVGVDLVAPPTPPEPGAACLRLIQASLNQWQPTLRFDLVTCVHGLHYIGDKLGLIVRAASWLTNGEKLRELEHLSGTSCLRSWTCRRTSMLCCETSIRHRSARPSGKTPVPKLCNGW